MEIKEGIEKKTAKFNTNAKTKPRNKFHEFWLSVSVSTRADCDCESFQGRGKHHGIMKVVGRDVKCHTKWNCSTATFYQTVEFFS